MPFLIGVIVLIIFVVFCYIFIKRKLNNYFGGSLMEIVKQARIEDEELPKSLSSMDSIYLEQIQTDFPDININELKRMSEKVILDTFLAVEKGDVSDIKNSKIKSAILNIISSNGNKRVRYSDFKFHNTVVSKYSKKNGVATIYFASSFQYILRENDEVIRKVQDRARVEFIYIIDVNDVAVNMKALGINCPNCGSPINTLGDKRCSYCGSAIVDVVKKVWTCSDMVRY